MSKAWIMLIWLAAAILPAQNAEPGHKWSYEGTDGPEHWAGLDTAYATCEAGHQQSPIDIQNTTKVELPALRFEYKSGPLKIINNGHTAVRVNYTRSEDFLLVGDKRYQLTQFHFHRPSEEYIHGKPYDMAIHFMHQAADGKVAAVVVLLKVGNTSTAIQQLWKYMPKTEGNEEEIAGVEFNPAALLPDDAAYYTYPGSLTAPPCTEGVTWFVLKTPVNISADEIDAFAKFYPHDVRPLQPLNGRIVKENK